MKVSLELAAFRPGFLQKVILVHRYLVPCDPAETSFAERNDRRRADGLRKTLLGSQRQILAILSRQKDENLLGIEELVDEIDQNLRDFPLLVVGVELTREVGKCHEECRELRVLVLQQVDRLAHVAGLDV